MLAAFRSAIIIPELRKRILFTLLVLALYRLGTFIPTPGVDIGKIREFLGTQAGSALGLVNLFSGGNFEQFSIFALGIMPYITAAIIMQLLVTVIPALEKLQKESEEGRRIITQYTRIAGIALGAVQGLFLATAFRLKQRGLPAPRLGTGLLLLFCGGGDPGGRHCFAALDG